MLKTQKPFNNYGKNKLLKIQKPFNNYGKNKKFFGFVSPVYAVNITLQWVPNSEPDLAGYRVFSREEGQSYDYANPSLEIAEASCNIYNLDENKTYYYVVRAFDTEGSESGDSNEVGLGATHIATDEIIIDNRDAATSQIGTWDPSSGADPFFPHCHAGRA